jgi:hypothetical protein
MDRSIKSFYQEGKILIWNLEIILRIIYKFIRIHDDLTSSIKNNFNRATSSKIELFYIFIP